MIDGLLGQLPPRSLFPDDMPRYPNVWHLVDEKLALRREYGHALRFLERLLDDELSLRDTFCDSVRNPNLFRLLSRPGEGSDFQARIGPLQAYGDDHVPTHDHQLHVRFYPTPLVHGQRTRATLPVDGSPRSCLLVPTSLHYEVASEDPLHPYVDSCPLCGITREYEVAIDPASQDYCQKIHDPLGVEFLLHGTIRRQRILWPDGTASRASRSCTGAAEPRGVCRAAVPCRAVSANSALLRETGLRRKGTTLPDSSDMRIVTARRTRGGEWMRRLPRAQRHLPTESAPGRQGGGCEEARRVGWVRRNPRPALGQNR